MKTRISILLLVFASTPAFADGTRNPNFVSAEYRNTSIDFDDYTLHADGYGLLFSTGISENFSLLAGYRYLDFESIDYLDTGQSQTRYDIGLGYQRNLLPRLDAYGSLRWALLDSQFDLSDDTDYGLVGDAGLRFWLSDDFEFDTSLVFRDLDDPIAQVTRELSITGQARWHLTDRLSLALGGEYGEYETAWTGSFRYALGGGQ